MRSQSLFILTVLALFLAAGCSHQVKQEKTADQLIEEGMEAFNNDRYQKAIKAFQKDQDNPWVHGCLGDAYARVGEVEKARAIIGELNQVRNDKYIRPTAIGRVYQGLGEIERALDWYEKAYEERDPTMAFFRLFAIQEPKLSSNPRYKEIIDKMGF